MQAVLQGEPSPMTHTGPLAVVILGLMSTDPGSRMDPDQAEALLNRVSSEQSPAQPSGHPPGRSPGHGGQAVEHENQASLRRALPDVAGPPEDHGFAPRPTLGFPQGAAAPRSEPPYGSRPPYAGEPAPPAGAAPDTWHPHPGQPFSGAPGRGVPAEPGRFAHPGQQSPRSDPAPGPPLRPGRRTGPGRPSGWSGRTRAARLRGQSDTFLAPGRNPAFRAVALRRRTSVSGRARALRATALRHRAVVSGFPPASGAARRRRGGHALRRPGVERIALLVGVPALVVTVGVGGWLLTADPDTPSDRGSRPVPTTVFPDVTAAEPSPVPRRPAGRLPPRPPPPRPFRRAGGCTRTRWASPSRCPRAGAPSGSPTATGWSSATRTRTPSCGSSRPRIPRRTRSGTGRKSRRPGRPGISGRGTSGSASPC
ncbi:hypothetical protein ACFQX6_23450 [Streptosporangium lutulentum]